MKCLKEIEFVGVERLWPTKLFKICYPFLCEHNFENSLHLWIYLLSIRYKQDRTTYCFNKHRSLTLITNIVSTFNYLSSLNDRTSYVIILPLPCKICNLHEMHFEPKSQRAKYVINNIVSCWFTNRSNIFILFHSFSSKNIRKYTVQKTCLVLCVHRWI